MATTTTTLQSRSASVRRGGSYRFLTQVTFSARTRLLKLGGHVQRPPDADNMASVLARHARCLVLGQHRK